MNKGFANVRNQNDILNTKINPETFSTHLGK